MKNTAVFAGSFDPFTMGHYDIVYRASKMFDKIHIGVASDTGKKCIASLNERTEMTALSVKDLSNVVVKSFNGFLVNFAAQVGANTIVRGIRTTNDFEYEKALNEVYRSQNSELEVFYLISSHNYSHISSTIVKELAVLGGNVKGYVKDDICELVNKLYTMR